MNDAVRGGLEPPIEVRQLDEPMMLLQRAAHGAHAGAQRTEEVQLVLSLIFTVLGVVAAATGVGRQAVIVLGAAWSLLSIVFSTIHLTQDVLHARDGTPQSAVATLLVIILVMLYGTVE